MADIPKDERPRSDAQHKATMRNWGIRNLRALYRLAHQLSPARRDAVQAIIDDELKSRGAMTTAEQLKSIEADYIKKGIWS